MGDRRPPTALLLALPLPPALSPHRIGRGYSASLAQVANRPARNTLTLGDYIVRLLPDTLWQRLAARPPAPPAHVPCGGSDAAMIRQLHLSPPRHSLNGVAKKGSSSGPKVVPSYCSQNSHVWDSRRFENV